MFLIRRAKPEDLDIIGKLAKTVHFINLPSDREIISEKIQRSRVSFRAVANGEKIELPASDGSAAAASPIFMFVIEDTETRNCLGTSMAVSKMGGPGHPNLSFLLTRKEMFSNDLQMGATHVIARLFMDESGPSEIGGLILGPSFRRHPARLGKQLSLIRFHYMGLHREYFADRVLAEMMAPITSDGRNLFWDALGRRFINLSYEEADRFCQHSREFMTSLLPKEDLFLSLLPAEARAVVGQVGKDTIPAKRMLESIGFKYTGRIDPFDGGPHLEARTDDINIVRDTSAVQFGGTCSKEDANADGFVSTTDLNGDFRALHVPFQLADDRKTLRITREAAELLKAEDAEHVGITPLPLHAKTGVASPKPGAPGKKNDKETAKP